MAGVYERVALSFADDIEETMEYVMRKTGEYALHETRIVTPEDTGNLEFYTVVSPDDDDAIVEFNSRMEREESQPEAEARWHSSLAQIGSYRLEDGPLYVYNNADYARYVNERGETVNPASTTGGLVPFGPFYMEELLWTNTRAGAVPQKVLREVRALLRRGALRRRL